MNINKTFINLFFLISIASLLPTRHAQAEIARGVVFDDKNANGKQDTGEPGIAGIHVSNGVDIATTNQNGTYQLTIEDDTIIFVIKPRVLQYF